MFVSAYHEDEKDILYYADNPYDDEVMHDEDVSCKTDDVSLTSVHDFGEEDSFSSCNAPLILDPSALVEDRASRYGLTPASDMQERGIDIAAQNDSIARHRGEKCNVSFVSSHYSLGSNEEDVETVRYIKRTYRIPSQRDRDYRCPTIEWEGSGTEAWSKEGEDWPGSSTLKQDEGWVQNNH